MGSLLPPLFPLAGILFALTIHRNVPRPYLDEVFHVGQAQTYCRGDFHRWDPKITTPPGLYLLSYLLYKVTGRCEIRDLRFLNAVLISWVAAVASFILSTLRSRKGQKLHGRVAALTEAIEKKTAVNIGLFPPLFFFSGLYYTDVPSTLFVLCSLLFSLKWQNGGFRDRTQLISSVILGLFSLLFRQTNIFWVAMFPAGLAVVKFFKNSNLTSATLDGYPRRSLAYVIDASWKRLEIYDVVVGDALLEDYLKVAVSLAIASVRSLRQVSWVVAPYLALIAAFGSFVVWNGGVVLGDKSNHIATIHLPQMLYIWPYILFFSFPSVLPILLRSRYLLSNSSSSGRRPSAPDLLPRLWVLALFLIFAAAAVHWNTIVHPFTLADNRHYMFYIFRYLRKYPLLKYLATPVYVLGGWLVIRALDRPPPEQSRRQHEKDRLQKPWNTKSSTPEPDSGCTASFVLVWLATTTLSVVSAPLVEPRYFILPWITWRLHVPSHPYGSPMAPHTPKLQEYISSENEDRKHAESKEGETLEEKGGDVQDYRISAETAWFFIINGATLYIFLKWGFAWPQEPGKIQRFMW